MNIRNAKHDADGSIFVEYEHPKYGWIPFSARSDDVEQLGRDLYALAAAGEVADADPVVTPVPQAVTMRQARLALHGAGLLSAVNAAINAAGEAAKIEWEYAQEVQRTSGLVPAMAAQLGMNDAQLDALFTAAAAL